MRSIDLRLIEGLRLGVAWTCVGPLGLGCWLWGRLWGQIGGAIWRLWGGWFSGGGCLEVLAWGVWSCVGLSGLGKFSVGYPVADATGIGCVGPLGLGVVVFWGRLWGQIDGAIWRLWVAGFLGEVVWRFWLGVFGVVSALQALGIFLLGVSGG